MCAIEGADDGAGVRLDVTLSPVQEDAFLDALQKDFGSIRARAHQISTPFCTDMPAFATCFRQAHSNTWIVR